jgi:hypothetical protein
MFGKPKRAKAVAKPASAEESIAVKKAVKEKYPQMSSPGWGKPVRRQTAVGKIKNAVDARQASLESALTPEEIARYQKRKATREGTREHED